MDPKRVVTAFFLSQLIVAAAAFAQSADTSEFARVSAGPIDVMTKHSAPLSGSFAITAARSQSPFGSQGNGKGYDATLGGTLVPDRVWFFASAQRSDSLFGSQSFAAVPTPTRAADTKMIAQLGDRQNLAASFATTRTSSAFTTAPIPSSFLSLHYTGIVSSNMFVTASFSELRRTNGGN